MNGERRTHERRTTARAAVVRVRRSAFVVLAFVVFSSQFAVLRSSAQEPAFKSGSSELVVLPVVVTDKQGRYVSDLPGEQFTVFDNGRTRADRAVHQRRHAGHRRADHRRQRQHAAEDRRGGRRLAALRALEQSAGRALRGPLQRRRPGCDADPAVSARRRSRRPRDGGQRDPPRRPHRALRRPDGRTRSSRDRQPRRARC